MSLRDVLNGVDGLGLAIIVLGATAALPKFGEVWPQVEGL